MKSYVRRISTIELNHADFSCSVFKCVLTDMVNGIPWNKGRIYIQNIVSIFLFPWYTTHRTTVTFFNRFLDDVKQSRRPPSNLYKSSRFLDEAEKKGNVGTGVLPQEPPPVSELLWYVPRLPSWVLLVVTVLLDQRACQ